ncbi:hypothetical protein FUAX_37810 [Fulvitalea axinellae]|uniref:Uroporphyrinogen decarboxylase n=1 Tax=Fulvitalea axinellae TaxID=1182444 RepID=A0AAU9CXT7_9BACT|nr:hypothetical protein FUAX_37810 [Fulvitalea axinellae]
MNYVEVVGYIAMVLLAVSFLFKDIKKLRVFNTVGCLSFVAYGLLLGAYPIVIVNAFIATVNVIQLAQMRKSEAEVS